MKSSNAQRFPLKILIILAVLVAGGLTAFAIWLPQYTTSNPNYCLSCHGEEGGLPNRGISSDVHPSYDQVSCVQCHGRHGQLLFEGYRKGFMAEPERLSPSCLRCHTSIVDRKDESGFRFNVFRIRISHKLHLNVGAKCTDCHSNIAHDLKTPRTNRPRMEYCAQCHAVQTESCTKCHGEKIPPGMVTMAPPAGVTGDGRSLYSKYCAECHGATGNQIAAVSLRSKEFLKARGPNLQKMAAQGHGGMPPFGRDSGGPLTDDEIRALIAYLQLSAEGAAVGGQTLFETYCAVCHGVQGDKMPAVTLNDPAFLQSRGRETVLQTIRDGRAGMPAFSKTNGGPLAYEEILSLEQYLSTLAGGITKDASALYAQHCTACHGEAGNQIPTANLASQDFLTNLGDAGIFGATAQGKGGMPAFGKAAGGDLSDDEIKAIIEYLKIKTGLLAPTGPPKIPHSLVGFDQCLNCHSSGAIKPFPSDHAGRTEEICQVCHKPKE